MFYGRVDVYWPDRPMESYRLNKETIAVGRSTGNDIVLDTTTISRYHITLTFKNQQALLEDLDSVNGTYVDSARLGAHDPFPLRGGEEIQIGEIRMIYHPPASLERVGSEDTTQRIVLTQHTYRIELDGPDMAVAPGAHVQATLKIENMGEAADRYFVEIDGLPKGWARADRNEIALEPGEDTQVLLSFKPLRRSESRPGDHPFVVRVRSKSRPAETLDATTTLHVLPFSGFGMALGTMRVTDQDGFKLYVHNQGNAILPLTLHGADNAQHLRIWLPEAQVQLGPGERRTLIGMIQPRRPRWFGAERDHEFAIQARALDASGFLVAVPGRYVERGRLPSWAPVLIVPMLALVVLLVLGLGLWLFGRGDGEPDVVPVIQAFNIDEQAVMLGEQVTVTWEVADTQSAALIVQSVRGQQQVTLDPADGVYYLTFDQTGRYTVTLQAANDGATRIMTEQVEVRPMVTLSLGVLGGMELVRNVQQDVRISWSVAGAKEYDGGYNVWVEASNQETPILVPPMALTGEQVIPLVLNQELSDWLVTLYAEGQDQTVASVTQKMPLVYPICELQASKTVVRSGPGMAYPAILPPQPTDAIPGATLSYSPVARDPSGAWLKVPVSIDAMRLGWVPLDDFICTNFDPESLLITADFPPPPENNVSPPEATATPAVSPEATAPPASGS